MIGQRIQEGIVENDRPMIVRMDHWYDHSTIAAGLIEALI